MRPTDSGRKADDLGASDARLNALYALIWRRAVASLMAPARIRQACRRNDFLFSPQKSCSVLEIISEELVTSTSAVTTGEIVLVFFPPCPLALAASFELNIG